MTEQRRIADELRQYASYAATDRFRQSMLDVADRIDAAHEKAIQQALMGEGGVPATDENMADLGWVRLPKDADGEYIHIGDVMEGELIGGGYGEPFEVVGYIMSNGELEPTDEHSNPRKRKYLRHYKQPTVEDVLEDFYRTAKADSDANMGDLYETIAEYAAKLQLRGDA